MATTIQRIIRTSTTRQLLQFRSMSTKTVPNFSADSDVSALTQELTPLLVKGGGQWSLIPSGEGLSRSFRFKTFKKTWAFMDSVAKECSVQKHHPEWSNIYNTAYIRWTTHNPQGLSSKDITMAKFCDQQAAEHGELPPEDETVKTESSRLSDLPAEVTAAGGCCGPKPK